VIKSRSLNQDHLNLEGVNATRFKGRASDGEGSCEDLLNSTFGFLLGLKILLKLLWFVLDEVAGYRRCRSCSYVLLSKMIRYPTGGTI